MTAEDAKHQWAKRFARGSKEPYGTAMYRAGQQEFRKVVEQVVSVWAGCRGAGYGKGNLDRAVDELRKVLALPMEGEDGV